MGINKPFYLCMCGQFEVGAICTLANSHSVSAVVHIVIVRSSYPEVLLAVAHSSATASSTDRQGRARGWAAINSVPQHGTSISPSTSTSPSRQETKLIMHAQGLWAA